VELFRMGYWQMSSNRPKLLIFLNSFWSYGSGISGGDQIIVQFLKKQASTFENVTVVTSKGGAELLRSAAPQASFVETSVLKDRLGLFPSYLLRTLMAIARIRRLWNADVILTGSDFFPDVVPSWILRKLKRSMRWTQFVFHVYPDWRKRPGSKLKSMVAQTLQRISFFLIRGADQVLTINHDVKAFLPRHASIDPARISVQHLGINFDEILASNQTDVPAFDGVFLARLMPSKGIHDLPKIWAEVIKQIPNARLAVIGGGAEATKTELRAAFDSRGLKQSYELLGFLDTAVAFSIMKRSKVFLFPSHEEGFGIAIAEAMACGLPVVAWNLKVYEEIFADQIQVAQENDIEGFAQATVSAIRGFSPESAAPRQAFVKRYSWASVTEGITRSLVRSQSLP
jgi:glycosyltransferase involved in cell wall biosynthesis